MKLANEFKDLDEAAQDGYNRYSAAVTALTEAENMGFGEIKKLINLARGELGEGSTEMENLEADYESWHRYNVEVERAAARQKAAWTMDELVAAKELPANVVSQSTLKIAKKSYVKKKGDDN